MLSKKNKHNYSISTKLTFSTQSPLKLFVIQLKKLIPLMEKLLGTSIFMSCELEHVSRVLQDFPRSLQRNKNLLNQVSVIELIEDIVKNLLSSKQQRKYKPYHLYINWKSVQEIVVKRIYEGTKGIIDQISSNPQYILLQNFIREIEFVGSIIQQWAKLKYSKKQKHSEQKLKFLYYEATSIIKTASPTARQTAVSTTCLSRNNSKHEKYLNQETKDVNQKTTASRIHMGKFQRKQMKLSTRCPSANQLLTNEFKKPLFQAKKSLRRLVSKLNDNTRHKRLSNKPNKSFNLNNFLISNTIQQNQKEKANLQKVNVRKVSILNKSFENNQRKQSRLLKEQNNNLLDLGSNGLYSLQIVDNAAKFNQNNQPNNKKQTILQQLDDKIRSKKMIRTQQTKKIENYSKRRQNTSLFADFTKRASVQSLQQLSKHQIKINKSKARYKASRKSGKLSIKSIESIKNQQNKVFIKKQVSNFTKRRKAMRNENKMSQIQKDVNQSKNQAQNKKIKFQENVLLALTDTIKLQKQRRKQLVQINQNDQTLQYKYSQLNKFIKNSRFSAQITPTSTFFEQQQHIKRSQDMVLKEKIKCLMKKQPTTNIFELACITKNNKDIIYNQFQRRFSFFSDAEWIKQANQSDGNFQQKNL